MKRRTITLPNGQRMRVPSGVQRIDTGNTHGWQVRYAGTKFFSDSKGTQRASLRLAEAELVHRINTLPAPVTLQRKPSAHKSNDLPPGISGPAVRRRPGREVADCSLLVLQPRYGQTPRRRTVYIGTEGTYTPARFQAALDRAIELRREAETAYRAASTRARRREARA